MFISVVYKDAPELSFGRRRSSAADLAVEKSLLLNPNCPVRVMLEYIRKRCKLGMFTHFDLCDESGALQGLFSLPTFACASDQFQHKRTYYIIVIRQEPDKHISVLPQLNHDNRMYEELEARVRWFMSSGEGGPPPAPAPPPPPPPQGKPAPKKK